MKKYKKNMVIFFVAGFGILTGLKLKELMDVNFVLEGNYKTLISMIMYFSLMSVMFFEWVKILKLEKKS